MPGNWQVIYHGANWSWSYDPNPADYANGSFIIWHLVDIVAKGGLMQIGYGPDRNGNFHPLAVAALEYTGQWLDINGEAIYGTRPLTHRWNDTTTPSARFTRPKDDNTTVYATILAMDAPVPTSVSLSCVSLSSDGVVGLLGHIDPNTRTLLPLPFHDDGKTLHISPPSVVAAGALLAPGYVFKLVGASERTC